MGEGTPYWNPLRGGPSRGVLKSSTIRSSHLIPFPEEGFHGCHLSGHLAVLHLQSSHLPLNGRRALSLLHLPVAVSCASAQPPHACHLP